MTLIKDQKLKIMEMAATIYAAKITKGHVNQTDLEYAITEAIYIFAVVESQGRELLEKCFEQETE